VGQGSGGVGDSPWCLRMPPAQLQGWQQWTATCWAGQAAAGVMSGVFGFTSWRSVAVQHCHGAQGLVLEHSQGWKLVYSGEGAVTTVHAVQYSVLISVIMIGGVVVLGGMF
jgi:hypothetical protein